MANNDSPDINSKLKILGKKMEEVAKASKIATRPLIDILEAVNKSIQEVTASAHQKSEEIIKKWPAVKKYEEAMLKRLGDSGWYIDSEIQTEYLHKLADMFLKGDANMVENILVHYYRSRLSSIMSGLCIKHPTRQIIIGKAYAAHNKGDYEISIPIFFTQIDGIYFDLVKEYFFLQKSKKFSKKLEKLSQHPFEGSIYYPLVNDFPISYSIKQRSRYKGRNKLNRHQILHGEVTDYGTEKNSLKAISLLNYVSWVLDSDEVKKLWLIP